MMQVVELMQHCLRPQCARPDQQDEPRRQTGGSNGKPHNDMIGVRLIKKGAWHKATSFGEGTYPFPLITSSSSTWMQH